MRTMTLEQKAKEYRKIANDLIDYVYLCSDRNIVPLKHDANVFINRFNSVDKARRSG